MRYTGADEPYVARNCRVRIAKQLEDKKLVTTKPEGRMNWLVCVPTPEGERALEILADRLRVRLRDQSVTERAKAGLV